MAKSFLTITNEVLNRLNEVEASTLASSRGIQTTAKNAVNDAIFEIVTMYKEWPFNKATKNQTLTIGTYEYNLPSGFRTVDWDSFFVRPAELVTNGTFDSAVTGWTDNSTGGSASISYSSGTMAVTGDGTNYGVGTQGLSTIVGKTYKLAFQYLNNDVTVYVGTTDGGSEVTSDTFTQNYEGQGDWGTIDFTATATTTYISFRNLSATAVNIDNVSCTRDIVPHDLRLMNQDLYRRTHKTESKYNDPEQYRIPEYVVKTQDESFIVAPTPDEAYVVDYDYWSLPSALSDDSDTSVIPDQYIHLVVARATAWVGVTRSDPQLVDRMNRMWKKGLDMMVTDLLGKPDDAVPR